MRKAALLLILFSTAIRLVAQPRPKQLNNDIGPFAEIQLFSDFAYANAQGIQLRHQQTKMFAWRLSAGHMAYQEQGGSRHVAPFFKDTIATQRVFRNLDGGFVSGGFEVQRQFFKKVFLYAGADVKIVYGTAQTDTLLSYEYLGPSPVSPDTNLYYNTYSFDKSSKDGSGFMASATFLLGARVFVGKRFIIGTEFTNPIYYTNSKTGNESGNSSNISLIIPQVSQRFSLSYRF